MTRHTMLRRWGAVPAAAILVAGPVSVTAAAQSTPAQQVQDADRLLQSGRYREAQTMYGEIARQSAGNARVRASALFGEALAAQQGSALEPNAGMPIDSLLTAYRTARTLDSARLFGPASNNAGLLLRSQGRHREALNYFLDAASTKHRARAYFYLNAGREHEQLAEPAKAMAAYRRALRIDPGYLEARQALLALAARQPSADSLLALAKRWGPDPATAPAVNDAIIDMMSRAPAELRGAQADSLLVALARNFATAGISAGRFGLAYAERLTDLERKLPSLAGAIKALRLACTDRPSAELYREPAEASWWQQSDRHGGRRKVWSAMLRVLGDRYNLRGDTDLAASFYEAAVGYPKTTFAEPWIDLDAFLPLGAIYVARLDQQGQDPRALERLNELTQQLFLGKGAAYQAGDLPRIRSFHMALGKMYADRGQWGDRYNARGALFQLEHMQTITQRMRQEGDTTAFDPPNLLETLAQGYFKTNRSADGRRAARAAIATYTKLRRDADVTRMTRWLEQQP